MISLGNLEIDGRLFGVRIARRPVELSYYEYELIRVLSEQPDRVLSYVLLTNALWSATGRNETRRLQVLVHRLRAKLTGSQPYTIETVRGRGYGLVAKLRTAS
jgi:DNA-binding response OmpR family regulator